MCFMFVHGALVGATLETSAAGHVDVTISKTLLLMGGALVGATHETSASGQEADATAAKRLLFLNDALRDICSGA